MTITPASRGRSFRRFTGSTGSSRRTFRSELLRDRERGGVAVLLLLGEALHDDHAGVARKVLPALHGVDGVLEEDLQIGAPPRSRARRGSGAPSPWRGTS